jgi:uncharacterized protein YdhG (YjbR/CyaY superfamily)
MKSSMKATPPKDIDSYLSSVPEPARTTLDKMRKTIQAAAPKATEKISYGIPTFHYLRSLVAFAAFKDHCSFFPMNSSLIAAYKADLKSYSLSKGTIRFPVDQPLPAALVEKMVKARLAQNEARQKSKRKK